MRKLTLILIPIFFSVILFAQESSQQVIGAVGEHYSSQGFLVSYTIGEPVVTYLEEGDFILTQGFHQTSCTITEVSDNSVQGFDLKIFPNPTTRFLNLNGDVSGLTCAIYDMSGRQIYVEEAFGNNLVLDLSYYSNGTYLLILTNEFGTNVEKYKIVKK